VIDAVNLLSGSCDSVAFQATSLHPSVSLNDGVSVFYVLFRPSSSFQPLSLSTYKTSSEVFSQQANYTVRAAAAG
jgi:hypothetical protein